MKQNKIYSIKELTGYIKSIIEDDPILSDMWIQGEISNFTHHSSGHMYFTLKDDSSRLRAIMFAGNNRFLKFIPTNGTKIIARGYISLYERDGQYQFYVQEMQPDGIGELYIAYEQLKTKLELEGLFDKQNKKELPLYPLTIGVITSATGAAVRDIITTLRRRYPIVDILIYPVLVQGDGAAKSIALAIEQMNKYKNVDILIVGRGGGSIEELWAFNEEIVARSIYQSKIPIISAVGHETDYTIADFVADVRAATPTAAAELAVPHIDELRTEVEYLIRRLEKQLIKQVDNSRITLNKLLRSVIFRRPKQFLVEDMQRVDHLQDKLHHSLNRNASYNKERFYNLYHRLAKENPRQKIQGQRERINYLKKHLYHNVQMNKGKNENKLSSILGKLDVLSPLKVMQRGYGIPYNEKEEQLIKSINDVQLGDIIKLHLVDGRLDCQIWGMEEKRYEQK